MALVFATMHLYASAFLIVSASSFVIFFFNLALVNKTEWSTIPACSSLMCSFNRGNVEGTNSSNLCLMFGHVCFVLCLRSDRFCGLT